MKKKSPTTVRFSDSVQKIKEELCPVYGLKNSLSAGLVLLHSLPAAEQKKVIVLINESSPMSPGPSDSVADMASATASASVVRICKICFSANKVILKERCRGSIFY